MAKIYICQWCNKVFTWRAMYEKHLPKCAAENEGTERDPLMAKPKRSA